MKHNNNNIVKYKRHFQLNIGFIICLIVFVYVLFHLFSYITKSNISVYEVTQGTINEANEYNALAIREEQVFYAPLAGSVYYFGVNNSKVGSKSLICSIDPSNTVTPKLNENKNLNLNDFDTKEISSLINSYTYDYNDSDFKSVYSFKTGIKSEIDDAYSTQSISSLADIMSESNSSNLQLIYGTTPGLLSFYIDGYEDLTIDSLTGEEFAAKDYSITNLFESESTTKGQPIFKEITSDIWYLYTEIDDALIEQIKDDSYIEITFRSDGISTWCAMEIVEINGKNYLKLRLDDGVERYADSRFLTIDLKLNEKSGLKIPNSSITTKEFFTVPKTYFMQGNDSTDEGLLVKNALGTTFVSPTIYYETEDYYYIDSEKIESGTKILKPASSETYEIGSTTATLEGVYSVNKGYAIFKQIEIIYQNEDYSLIKTGTDYGLSLYDRIALQGDHVKENEIIQ